MLDNTTTAVRGVVLDLVDEANKYSRRQRALQGANVVGRRRAILRDVAITHLSSVPQHAKGGLEALGIYVVQCGHSPF